MIERRRALTLTVVMVFLSSVLSFYAGASGLLPQLSRKFAPGADPQAAAAGGIDARQLQRVLNHIQSEYVESPVPIEKLTEGALKGMVEATGDKYSVYFNASEYKQFLDHFKASFSGIGVHVELSPKSGLITVVSPIKGSPGERAGLRPGDSIVTVDGTDIKGMTLEQAVQLIRGPKGTKVQLQVLREGQAEPLAFTITRATIQMPSLEYKMVDAEAGVGYVQVIDFNQQIGERTAKAIADLRAQGMNRLILDLRQNPGGLLEEAIEISSIFVPPQKPVVHIVYRDQKKETFGSSAKEPFTIPLVVLVDENSASASEIVAGAIKDMKVGTLMGVKTFGKGSVQTFYNLPDGAGIKLTTAKYLTAGENSIHEKGIEPDIVVENPNKVLPGDPGDVQLAEAIKYIKTMKR